ncbi:MAG: hypothetical protein ACF8GE_08095 [Phycisphaerales bacterium JB043]
MIASLMCVSTSVPAQDILYQVDLTLSDGSGPFNRVRYVIDPRVQDGAPVDSNTGSFKDAVRWTRFYHQGIEFVATGGNVVARNDRSGDHYDTTFITTGTAGTAHGEILPFEVFGTELVGDSRDASPMSDDTMFHHLYYFNLHTTKEFLIRTRYDDGTEMHTARDVIGYEFSTVPSPGGALIFIGGTLLAPRQRRR